MKIADLLAEFKEPAGKNCSLPVLTLTEKRGFVYQADRFDKRLATEDVSRYKIVRRGDLAFNPYLLWAGAVAHNSIVDAGVISPLYPTFRVKPGMDDRFVARRLLTPQMISAYDTIAFGSVPRRRRSSVADFLDLDAGWVPPLAEQRRIAAILDQADAIRTKRRREIEDLRTLKRAVFNSIFRPGVDPLVALSEVCAFRGGASLPEGEKFHGQEAGLLLMKVSDMNAVGNELEIVSTASWAVAGAQRSATVESGAVVFPKRGAAIATNKKRLTTRQTALDPNLMGLQPDLNVVKAEFIFGWIDSFDLSSISSGSTVPQLNKKDLAPLMIPMVSLSEQGGYAKRVSKLDDTCSVIKRALVADDELFASLQSRAFRGEL